MGVSELQGRRHRQERDACREDDDRREVGEQYEDERRECQQGRKVEVDGFGETSNHRDGRLDWRRCGVAKTEDASSKKVGRRLNCREREPCRQRELERCS